MREGEAGAEMYMLMSGEVEVLVGAGTKHQSRLGFLSSGSFFGEIPLLSEELGAEIRTRTVRAVTECELCFLTRDEVADLRKRYPELDMRFRRFSRFGAGSPFASASARARFWGFVKSRSVPTSPSRFRSFS